jgi:hypothetical protein
MPPGVEGSPVGRNAWVEFDNRCQRCGDQWETAVWFWWGGVISPSVTYGPVYRVGDAILWALDGDAQLLSSEIGRSYNLGSPTKNRVVVYDARTPPRECRECGERVPLWGIEVVDGVIAGVRPAPEVDDLDRERVWYDEFDAASGALLKREFFW